MDDNYIKVLTEAVERGKSNTLAIEDLKEELKEIHKDQKAIYTIATSVELIAKDMKNLKQSVNEIKDGQYQLAEKVNTQITEVRNDVKIIEEKGKFDWPDFVKRTLLPLLIGGGAVYAILQIIK